MKSRCICCIWCLALYTTNRFQPLATTAFSLNPLYLVPDTVILTINFSHNVAFCTDNHICHPDYGISWLNRFNLSAFSLLSCLPTLKKTSYLISSSASYRRLVYLTWWDSHPLYYVNLHIRTVWHRYSIVFKFLYTLLNLLSFLKRYSAITSISSKSFS